MSRIDRRRGEGIPAEFADVVRRAFLPRRYVQVYLDAPLLRGLTPEVQPS